MTGKDLVEILIDRVAEWPEDARAELVQSIVEIEEKFVGVYHLSDEERVAVRRGLEEMRQGKFASEEEVEALFRRYRG